MLDALATFILYATVYFILGPMLFSGRGASYQTIVVGLHFLTAVAAIVGLLVLSIQWAITQLLA